MAGRSAVKTNSGAKRNVGSKVRAAKGNIGTTRRTRGRTSAGGEFFGRLLHEYREKEHLSVQDLSKKAKVPASTITRIEKQGTTRWDMFQKIANGLGYRPEVNLVHQ